VLHRLVTILLAGSILTAGIGCASNMSARKRIESRLPAGARIAVLPIENLSGAENAGEKVTSYFQATLTQSERLQTVPYGEVYDGLRRYRIRSAALITSEQIDSLAASLPADYFLSGSVLEYEERDDRFLGIVPQVSFNCRLIDGRTGETVWVATSNGRGDKGEFVFGIGAIRSADYLSRKMVEKAVGNITDLFAR